MWHENLAAIVVLHCKRSGVRGDDGGEIHCRSLDVACVAMVTVSRDGQAESLVVAAVVCLMLLCVAVLAGVAVMVVVIASVMLVMLVHRKAHANIPRAAAAMHIYADERGYVHQHCNSGKGFYEE